MSSIGTNPRINHRGPRAAPAGAETLFAELVGWRDAERLTAPWRELADRAAEANPFYEPWTLLPALEHYANARTAIACVWDARARSRLLAFAPVERNRGYARLAVGYWTNWIHPHCYFGAPLIERSSARAAAAALLGLLCDGPGGRAFLALRRVYPDAPVADALRDAALRDGREFYVSERFERAALFAGPSAECYLTRNLRKKKRKELARLRNRLAELGPVSIRKLTDAGALGVWTENFLALEDSGWKSARGTSLRSSPADAAWFRESLKGALDAGRLDFLRLDCGARPVAMLVNLGAAARYSLKIAFDPDFARYSPGLMIEIEATRRLLGDRGFAFADSCAAPDHSMINRLWKNRRAVASVNVSGAGAAAISTLRLCRFLETARAAAPGGRAAASTRAAP